MPKTQSLLWKLNYKSQLLEWWITGFRPSNVACQAGEKNQNKTKSTWKTQEKVQMTVQKASNSPLKYERGSRPMDEELTRKRESSIEVMVHNIRKTQLPSKWQKLPLPSIGIASFLWSGNHTEISWATGQNLITNNSKNMGFLLSCSKCYLNVTFSIPVPPVMRKLYTKQTNHVKHVPCHSSLLINNTRQITAGVVAVTSVFFSSAFYPWTACPCGVGTAEEVMREAVWAGGHITRWEVTGSPWSHSTVIPMSVGHGEGDLASSGDKDGHIWLSLCLSYPLQRISSTWVSSKPRSFSKQSRIHLVLNPPVDFLWE